MLTPGLIDIHSHIGLYEDGLGFEGADGNEDTDPATPHLRALDGVNPFDRSFREALEAGVTAAAVSPGQRKPDRRTDCVAQDGRPPCGRHDS